MLFIIVYDIELKACNGSVRKTRQSSKA